MKTTGNDTQQQAMAAALSVLALVALLLLASSRGSLERVSGDEGTYLAMAESLAEDFDLRFDDRDEERVAGASDPGRRTVILQRTPTGISYSKPLLPAFLTAPFFAVLGDAGLVVANVLMLALALGLLWIYLRAFCGAGATALTIVTVAASGALLPYVVWKSGDVLQAALAMAGLTLALGSFRDSHSGDVLGSRWAPWAGMVLLGLLVALRPPYLLIGLIVPLAAVLRGEWRRAFRLVAALSVAVLVVLAVSWALVGTAMPYKTERATFNAQTGYPAGEDVDEVSMQFESGRATSSLGVLPDFKPRVTAFSALYFLVGRHTGVLIYFPAALFLILAAARSGDRITVAVLLGVGATSLFFLLWLPFNYFGGGSCVGNRYFLACYAALPVALRRPLGRRSLAACWLLALVVGGSALASERLEGKRDRTSQSHAYAGIFRLLPYETTASDLEGSRDRYFGKDFVRAVDPFTDAGPWSFRLEDGRPAAEFVLANLDRNEPLRLLVHSGADDLVLVYSDYGQSKVNLLRKPIGLSGFVEFQPSHPNRYHPLWFRNPWDHGKPYWVRVFRLAVRGAGGSPATATIRFLGNEEFPPRLFERTVLDAELPESVEAGSVSRVLVRVVNDNQSAWRSGGLFPVYLSYKLESATGEGTEGARTPLPGVVRPTTVLETALEIHWPETPGRYRVRVDLVAEGVAWFEREVGAALIEGAVEVLVEGTDE